MKLTLEDLEKIVVREHYYVVPETTLTICTLITESNATVVGNSEVIDKDNFNEQDGRDYAKADAISQLWELEGYYYKISEKFRKYFVGFC